MVNTARVFLRNLHPECAMVLPLGDGRSRVLAPGVTTAVPATTAGLPSIARLLAMQAITVVGTTPGSIASDADARQDWADRADMTGRIRSAEQREFAVLRRGLRAPVRQPSNQSSTAYAHLKSATASAGVAPAVLRAVLNGEAALPATLERFGLPKPASRSAPSTLRYVHWRRRDRLARTWLDAVQRKRRIADPAQAAAWLAGELAAALPAARAAAPGVLPRWPPERTALLCRMWANDVPVPEIMTALGLSRGAVQGKATLLGLPGRHGRLRINHA